LSLADLSIAECKLDFNPGNYDETQTDPKVAELHIKELLNFQTNKQVNEQKKLLKGKQQDNWLKFCKKQKEQVAQEVMIHQVAQVISIGWEPASNFRPTQLTKDGKLKGSYVITGRKLDGTIVEDLPAQTEWMENNFKPEVLAAA
jgi:hypothetical protein